VDEVSLFIFGLIVFSLEGVAHLSFGLYLNQIPHPYSGQIGYLMIQVLLNALTFPFTFWVLRWIDSQTLEADLRSRRTLKYDF
jgi:hypothetical protein